MELFKIKFNGPLAADDLYYRSNGFDPNTGILSLGRTLTLDTYFNSFSCLPYLRYTTISRATAEIDVEGAVSCQLMLHRDQGPDEMVSSRLDGETRRRLLQLPFDFSQASGSCFYYLSLTAESDGCKIYGGCYRSAEDGDRVRLAIVICSYRREEYVTKNVQLLRSTLLDSPESPVLDDIELIVIDNGNTLSGLITEDQQVVLVPNKNCGGSGGFTRGIIEVLKRRQDFSHILLMDDDVRIDPNTIQKTVQFLKLLRPEYANLYIAGGMLRLDEPTIQEEASARWDGDLHSLNAGLNLADRAMLLENERPKKADYGAWWYMCMPLNLIQENNLPLPFFIKADDVEYGMRNMTQVLVMNGIGVWHEGFAGKETPYMDYYIIRNYLVVGSIHDIPRPAFTLLMVIFKRMMRTVAFGIPEAAVFIEMAVTDYIKGVDFFLNTDSETLNTQLRTLQTGAINTKGITKAQKIKMLVRQIPTTAFWYTLCRFGKTSILYLRNRRWADTDYKSRWSEIACLSFWNKLMNLE